MDEVLRALDWRGIGGRSFDDIELVLYIIPVPVLGLGRSLVLALSERAGTGVCGGAAGEVVAGSDALRNVLEVIEGTGTAGRSPTEDVRICRGNWSGRT